MLFNVSVVYEFIGGISLRKIYQLQTYIFIYLNVKLYFNKKLKIKKDYFG